MSDLHYLVSWTRSEICSAHSLSEVCISYSCVSYFHLNEDKQVFFVLILFVASSGLEGDKTYEITQNDIKASADEATQQKIFDLRLDKFGPYRLDYTRNGRLVFYIILYTANSV